MSPIGNTNYITKLMPRADLRAQQEFSYEHGRVITSLTLHLNGKMYVSSFYSDDDGYVSEDELKTCLQSFINKLDELHK